MINSQHRDNVNECHQKKQPSYELLQHLLKLNPQEVEAFHRTKTITRFSITWPDVR